MDGQWLWAPTAPSLSNAGWWKGTCRRLIYTTGTLLLAAAASSSPRYKPGDLATNDVVAPFDFAVVNHERTERLRREELAKVPAVYRCDPWSAVQAEEKLGAFFSSTRTAFLDAMEVAAKKRVVDEATVDHPSFWRFVDWFRQRHPDFPITTNIAKAWALNRDDAEPALRLALREAMRQYIRGDVIPDGADTPEVQVFVTEQGAMPTTLEDLQTSARIIPGSDAPRLSEAQERLKLPEDLAEFRPLLAPHLRENLIYEEWLTTLKRQRRSAELVAFDQYSPGQVVVFAGQVIDTKAAAALEVLTEAEALRESRAVQVGAVPASRRQPVADIRFTLEALRNLARQYPSASWILAALLVMIIWGLSRRGSAAARPQPITGAYTLITNPARPQLPAPQADRQAEAEPASLALHAGGEWQTELRDAERRAEELLSIVRAGLAPHLARELTHKLVQELVTQRATLLRAHQMAEREIVALEARFAKVCNEMQERIAAYERRAIDLEKELIARAEQTRELMNATILLTEQKLKAKKTEDPFAYN
jgi:hypothetical protein